MATIEEINDNNFNQVVLESNILVVVDFWAPWCGPCRKLTPVLEQIQSEFKEEIKVVKIDAEKTVNFVHDYNIQFYPEMLIFKNGKLVGNIDGYVKSDVIVEKVKEYL